jgi:hypothetical protein
MNEELTSLEIGLFAWSSLATLSSVGLVAMLAVFPNALETIA